MAYEIEEAFKAIEDELIDSMIRNMKHHRAEELREGFEWTSWQTLQLNALRKYSSNNRKKFTKQFADINAKIEEGIRQSRLTGNMDAEIEILEAIKKGFKASKVAPGMQAEFFKVNDRKLDALIEATKNDMQKAEHAMLRMADDQYRQVIFNAQVYANTGAGTYEKAVDMATKDYLSRGINCIQYKNGARVDIASYAAMAIRTANTRAYLTGEGEKRREWGISTVIVNKRGHACLKCLKWTGRVLIDDVWSGGKKEDGDYPLMSTAMAQGLYHPNCKDIHTTFFPGITAEPKPLTRQEVEESKADYMREQEINYANRQKDKFKRLADGALDPDDKAKYQAKAKEWKHRALEMDAESELGTFKKNLDLGEGMEKEYYDVIKTRFSHGTKDAKRVYNKYVPKNAIEDNNYEWIAKYENGKIKMHFGMDLNNTRGPGATWFHEHGHLIDDQAGYISHDKKFLSALFDDFIDISTNKSYIEIEEELVDMRIQSGVADIINGLSEDKIKGVAFHALRTDGSSYWTKESICEEAFAHMFECQFDDLRCKEMKKYFPRALKVFEDILKGM